ncbi:hypothetical protein BC832DRAFT_592905 [Gaertneriomyces semiglobifer]|nr:hypothetical protein BC832DRAFT_592905 [Gaertneriomyces semiglobifer]
MARDEEEIPPWTECYSEVDLEAAIRVFKMYAQNPTYMRHAETEERIQALFQYVSKAMFPTGDDMKARRKQKKQKRKDKDKEALAVVGIRQMRKVKMVGYTGGSVDLPMPPRIATKEANEEFTKQEEERLKPSTSGDIEDAATVNDEKQSADDHQTQRPKLKYARSCHVCGTTFRELHHFYDQLCPSCAEHNFTKRFSEADMRGRVCIVTGARVKIGYAIALKLLRMGATVIVTTRFPHDCANRYAKEPDFSSFEGRLSVYGLDFRDIPMLHHFCNHVKERYNRLDAIINNAAQTVRKPPAYYQHLIVAEAEELDPAILKLIDVVDVYRTRSGGYLFGHGGRRALEPAQTATLTEVKDGDTDATNVPGLALGVAASQATATLGEVNASAAMSQLVLVEGDKSSASAREFPPGLYDRDDQQVDLRSENSWTQELGQIGTVEMMECHVINAFAPWVLISELKPLMERTGPVNGEEGTCDKFVVNVSAMEGQFYRHKTIFHPHSNMAKASLNMLTRTAAAGLAAVNIFMTAVDTGWITDENPVDQWHKRENAPPPLDEWDAAMRVLDPVLIGVRGEEKLWGVFLKNYRPTRW